VADKIDALNAAFVAGKATAEQLQDKGQLEKDLHKKMKRVDAEKYAIETAPDIGYSGFTPASDGRFIYTWYGNGVSACYDLDGNRRWIRTDRFPAVEHGFSSSPLLVDEKFVVFMRDLLALDAVTGRLAWQVPVADHEGLNPAGFFHGSPTATSIGGVRIIVLPNGTLLRAGDGKVLYECRRRHNPSGQQQHEALPAPPSRQAGGAAPPGAADCGRGYSQVSQALHALVPRLAGGP
jgi:hypothetical protein